MANYDITFRFPQSFTLVATGKQVSLEQDGGQSIGHWISDGPVPIAGFNLGRYIKTSANAGDVNVDSYATRGVEKEMPQAGASGSSTNVAVSHDSGGSHERLRRACHVTQSQRRAVSRSRSVRPKPSRHWRGCSDRFRSVRCRSHNVRAQTARAGPASSFSRATCTSPRRSGRRRTFRRPTTCCMAR